MRQILQDLRNGETQLVEVPCPNNSKGTLLIRSVASLVSVGTEKMLINFGKASWINKARSQPDKVRQVIDKVKTDGVVTTINAINSKLSNRIPLGYSNVGRVLEVGSSVEGYSKGDLVVSNGPHAEIVCVEKNLCALVPKSVAAEEAAFTVIGSIGLQGIRLMRPSLGEYIVVTGLGLIGLLSVQILKAHGCRVIGIDFDAGKCQLARSLGAETIELSSGVDPVSVTNRITNGRGVDGVLITASTSSNEPIHQAAMMCRQRGRIILIGVTGLELSRADFYEKELSFQVSCSYGPGRYDPSYEQEGNDYPVGLVRWTERRNFEAVLQLMDDGAIDVRALISHQYDFSDAVKGYGHIGSGESLGILLKYEDPATREKCAEAGFRSQSVRVTQRADVQGGSVCVGLIGAGGFTGQVLLPALLKTKAHLRTIVSAKGVSGTQLAKRFKFEISSTDHSEVFDDPKIDTIIISTRHNTHGELVLRALNAGKRVYVEKPLCIKPEELESIESCYNGLCSEGAKPYLMVGFNRRFAPQIQKIRAMLVELDGPKAFVMRINSGAIPKLHWTQDMEVGGGRMIGEGCHFIDLLRFLADSSIRSIRSSNCTSPGSLGPRDTISVFIEFLDGSIGTVHYFSNGHRAVMKERLEIFCAGRVLELENFRRLQAYGWKSFKSMNLWRQDKGHSGEMQALVSSLEEKSESPIPFEQIVEVTRASFQAAGLLPNLSLIQQD